MARDDYFVIVYKILSYMYQQLKKGKKIEAEMLLHDGVLFKINYEYWFYIFKNLVDQEYISGLSDFSGHGYYLKEQLANCMITPKGIHYLCDNTLFEKAKRFLKDVKEITPFI